jgi:tRNA threonylcarbamoyladenosine biosynthesis protein TsaB
MPVPPALPPTPASSAVRSTTRTDVPALLAFDTSTEVLAVAARGPLGDATRQSAGGAAASADLLPQIDAVLREAGLVLADLAAIAFGRGPGAFTGLRTSCAVAQGLGLGLGCPLLPLDSLMIVAEDAAPSVGNAAAASAESVGVAVAMDARMDEIYGAIYERAALFADVAADAGNAGRVNGGLNGGQGWRALLPPALFTLDAWNAELERRRGSVSLLAGSALSVFGTRLHRPAHVQTVPAEAHRARALLRLAQQAWNAGAAVDAAAALPLYLRDKVALTTIEREAQRQARALAGTT